MHPWCSPWRKATERCHMSQQALISTPCNGATTLAHHFCLRLFSRLALRSLVASTSFGESLKVWKTKVLPLARQPRTKRVRVKGRLTVFLASTWCQRLCVHTSSWTVFPGHRCLATEIVLGSDTPYRACCWRLHSRWCRRGGYLVQEIGRFRCFRLGGFLSLKSC